MGAGFGWEGLHGMKRGQELFGRRKGIKIYENVSVFKAFFAILQKILEDYGI